MILFPAFLKLAGRRCLVVGAGPVAEEKIEGLLRAGADVRVVAPDATRRIRECARAKKIRWDQRAVSRLRSFRCVPHRRRDIFSFAPRANLPAGAAARPAVQRGRRSRALRFLLRLRGAARRIADRDFDRRAQPRSRAAIAKKTRAGIWRGVRRMAERIGKDARAALREKNHAGTAPGAPSRACERGFV